MMYYYDRNNQKHDCTTKQDKLLNHLYGSVAGRQLIKVISKPIVSKAVGLFLDSPLSIPMIDPFIRKNRIDMKEYIPTYYHSYNEFFTRKIHSKHRPVDSDPKHFISPCDGKISVYPIKKDSVFTIKGADYTVRSLVKSKALADKYLDGYCMIIRLTVDNYHRYSYIDNGKKSRNYFIPGVLHTVNPVALDHVDYFKQNSREFTLLKTRHFGTVTEVEVGAMMVGKINNHMQEGYFKRGQEKGMFEFGGSTIVLLVQKNKITVDEDILRHSEEGCETMVKLGEKIAEAR